MPIDKKKMRFKVNARIASKVREKDLLKKAEALKEDYELILPTCSQKCRACPFVRTRAHLERVARFKEDPDKLAKLASKGDKLARAYAATVGLAHDKKAPYLASATYPKGTVMFALRGKTSREKLIGVQNYDSPQWRVLAVLDLVKKGKLHFYSYGDKFVCTGRTPKAPDDYIRLAAEAVGARDEDGNSHSCPHDPASSDHLEFRWRSADRRILLCDQCAMKSKNTLVKLAEGIAVPDVLEDIEVSVHRPLVGESDDDACKDLLTRPVDRGLLDEYAAGKIGDRELIDRHLEDVNGELMQETRRIFVRGDRCFGDDVDAFIDDIAGDPLEAAALGGLLSKMDHPVVVGAGETVNKLLSSYWKEHGRDALEGVVSPELAQKYFDDGDEALRSPLKVIRRAAKKADSDRVTSEMPSYDGLSAHARFADDVVRAYKTGGGTAARTLLDGETSADPRMRAMVHAFNLALGITTKAWKFTNEEQEFGKHLKKYASELLRSKDTEAHHEAFTGFLRQAGVTEEVTRL